MMNGCEPTTAMMDMAVPGPGINQLDNYADEVSELVHKANSYEEVVDMVGDQQAFIIGRGMEDVKAVGRQLKEDINVKWYQFWKKNWPEPVSPQQVNRNYQNNMNAIQRKMNEGFLFLDLGDIPGVQPRTPDFYAGEVSTLERKLYPRIDISFLRPER